MSGRTKQRIPEPQTLLAARPSEGCREILPVMPFFFLNGSRTFCKFRRIRFL